MGWAHEDVQDRGDTRMEGEGHMDAAYSMVDCGSQCHLCWPHAVRHRVISSSHPPFPLTTTTHTSSEGICDSH